MSERHAAPPVLCIGETLVDLIVTGASSLEEASTLAVQPGGAPANVAVGLAKLGVPAAFCGVVGADPFGAKLRSALTAYHVDISRLRSVDGVATTIAFAWKDARGDGHFQIIRMADALLSPDDAVNAGIASVHALVIGSVSLTAQPSRAAVERATALAVDAGVPVCFDVNIRPPLWASPDEARLACEPLLSVASLIKVSRDDAAYLLEDDLDPGQIVQRLDKGRNAIIVLTDGPRGAWYADRRAGRAAPRHLPAFAVVAVDPTGAGDGFTAGLIARLRANDWSGLDAADLRYASAVGALTASGRGAMSSLPTASEVEAFLTQHPA